MSHTDETIRKLDRDLTWGLNPTDRAKVEIDLETMPADQILTKIQALVNSIDPESTC